nr:hypothetical protein [Caenimonas aquaedulcis]
MRRVHLGAYGDDRAARNVEIYLEELLAPLTLSVCMQSLENELLGASAISGALLEDALEATGHTCACVDIEVGRARMPRMTAATELVEALFEALVLKDVDNSSNPVVLVVTTAAPGCLGFTPAPHFASAL